MATRSSWHAVAQAWPKDHLRPTRQFSEAISQAADRAFLQSPAFPATTTAPASSEGALRELSAVQQAKAREAVASLQRLLDNSALKAHPMTEKTTKPASFPKHYARILDSIQRAEAGEVFKKPMFSWFRWE